MSQGFFVDNIQIGRELFFILGPCVIEDEQLTLEIAAEIKLISQELKIPFIFKASFDKANRTSKDAYRGPGLIKGLKILQKVREQIRVPVISDIHTVVQAPLAAEVLSMIQIPAFLCRQTDLLLAAGRTGLPINIKKGQFLSAEAMAFAVDKVRSTGNNNVLLTERGNSFGYNELVVDMKNIPKLKHTGVPVVIDATHSVQQPSTGQSSTGGNREFVPDIACGAVACGADGVFLEVHPNPDRALSDSANSLAVSDLKALLEKLKKIYNVVNE
jgi:2-dehydro-3-deoxyphosphooctonate aldolase (KDO 8-P synthase)